MSRNALILSAVPEDSDCITYEAQKERIKTFGILSIHSITQNAISQKEVTSEGQSDTSLIDTIETGFPSTRYTLNPQLRDFWEYESDYQRKMVSFTKTNVLWYWYNGGSMVYH